VRCEQFAPYRRTVLLGKQGQQSVADFKLLNHGAEAKVVVSMFFLKDLGLVDDVTYP
jgi:hypothetical protein